MLTKLSKEFYLSRSNFLSGKLYEQKQRFYEANPYSSAHLPPIPISTFKGFREYLDYTKNLPQLHPPGMFKPIFGYGLMKHILQQPFESIIDSYSPDNQALSQSFLKFMSHQSKTEKLNYRFKAESSVKSNIFTSKCFDSLPDDPAKNVNFLLLVNFLCDCPNDRVWIKDIKELQKSIKSNLQFSSDKISDYLQVCKEIINRNCDEGLIKVSDAKGEFVDCDYLARDALVYYCFPKDFAFLTSSQTNNYLKESVKFRELGLKRALTDYILDRYDEYKQSRERCIWLSTFSLKLAESIALSNYKHLVLFDYSSFGESYKKCDYSGDFMPLVYTEKDDKVFLEKSNSILDENFVTNSYSAINFDFLSKLFKLKYGYDSKLQTMNGFFQELTEANWFETTNGYNPLIHSDNSSSFLIVEKQNLAKND